MSSLEYIIKNNRIYNIIYIIWYRCYKVNIICYTYHSRKISRRTFCWFRVHRFIIYNNGALEKVTMTCSAYTMYDAYNTIYTNTYEVHRVIFHCKPRCVLQIFGKQSSVHYIHGNESRVQKVICLKKIWIIFKKKIPLFITLIRNYNIMHILFHY